MMMITMMYLQSWWLDTEDQFHYTLAASAPSWGNFQQTDWELVHGTWPTACQVHPLTHSHTCNNIHYLHISSLIQSSFLKVGDLHQRQATIWYTLHTTKSQTGKEPTADTFCQVSQFFTNCLDLSARDSKAMAQWYSINRILYCIELYFAFKFFDEVSNAGTIDRRKANSKNLIYSRAKYSN